MKTSQGFLMRRLINRSPEHIQKPIRMYRRNPSKRTWKRIRQLIIYPKSEDLTTVWQAVESVNSRQYQDDEHPSREEFDQWLEVWFQVGYRRRDAVL